MKHEIAPKRTMEEKRAATPPRVLLVQSDPSESGLQAALERGGFEVVTKASMGEALNCLCGSTLAALVCDLHLPSAGDGFTLVNATRHLHPEAVTIILSDYPSLRESLTDLLPQADEILVTPLPSGDIVTLLKNRLRNPQHRLINPREPVSTILERHATATVREWLARVNVTKNLIKLEITDQQRKGHLHALLNELVERLRAPHLEEGTAKTSPAAVAHGKARRELGYTAAMLVEESRILQVCIFKTLRTNLNAVDLALVLTDVMTIADEVDSQLTQTMAAFSGRPGRRNDAQAMMA